jgi:TolB protein
MNRIGLALVAAVALLAAAPAAHATFPGKPGQIVFFSLDRQDDQLLYRINPSGGKVRPAPFAGHNAAYSADGRYVAYLGNDGFRVANADGTDPRPVPGGGEPAWSPSGREIASTFTNYEDYPYIDIVDVATGVTRHLTDGEDPSWSPDGRTILFNTANHGALCKIRPDGTGKACFTAASKLGAQDPDWSPGGRAIVVAAGTRIAVLRSDGSFARWISPPIKKSGSIQTRVFNPSWSPDGKRVVYERGKGYNRGSLYVTGDRGGSQRYLTGGTRPVWAPAR